MGIVMMKNTISNSTDSYIFSEDEWSADEEWVAESRRRARKKKEQERQRRLYAHLLAAAAVLFAAIVLVLVWGTVHGAFRSWGKQSAGASVSGTGNPANANNLTDSDGTENQTAKHSALKPDINVQLLTINKYSRPGDKLDAVNAIVVHYTANPGTTAEQNRDYFESLAESGETSASSHFVIGIKGEIIQCVPCDEVAYASNDRNSDTISIECCHTDENGEFTDATYQSLVALVAWLVCEYDLEVTDVIRHYDVTGKICPKYYVEHPEAWERFLEDVEALLFTL